MTSISKKAAQANSSIQEASKEQLETVQHVLEISQSLTDLTEDLNHLLSAKDNE
ncbi:hypothetical protein LCY76_18900 [Fictibacillus sp. KIGAM418]|uniref:Uncharacterized protein n=1 Tax=Fictibacillus marinisediminis TaxID=2878389 RepID=A0A9X2BFC9_9BACL|nr:hypothetical protein [Fictibacillus marinisediminis]MCK6258640.1 hypothetical protein [Fictibacillus marinisediminis]